MKDGHFLLCSLELVKCQYETVLDSVKLVLIEETLLLNTCHIKDVKFRHNLFHSLDFSEFQSPVKVLVIPDIVRQTKVIRSNEDYFIAFIPCKRLD